MVLVYHNITPPEYFVNVHPLLVRQCFRGRRELSAYADRATSRWAIGVQPAGAGGDGIPAHRVLPVVPDFAHLDAPPDRRLTRSSTTS